MLQIVCDRDEAYALGCAVARAFPRYQKSSGVNMSMVTQITVAFIFTGDNQDPLTDQERMCLKQTSTGNHGRAGGREGQSNCAIL